MPYPPEDALRAAGVEARIHGLMDELYADLARTVRGRLALRLLGLTERWRNRRATP